MIGHTEDSAGKHVKESDELKESAKLKFYKETSTEAVVILIGKDNERHYFVSF